MSIDERCREAFDRAVAGDLRPAGALIAELAARADADARACHAALSSLCWQSYPRGVTLPDASTLAMLIGSSPAADSALSLAFAQLARAALLRFDAQALEQTLAQQARCQLADAALRPWLDAGVLWLHLLRGERDGLADHAAALEGAAARAGSAPLVIEAAALRALALLSVHDREQAREVARRASRMARTEGLPWWEYLANVVLARVRRLDGRPFMAIRILSALAGAAPPQWLGWIGWELLLAGADQAARPAVDRLAEFSRDPGLALGGPREALYAAIELLRCCDAGDAAGYALRVARLRQALAGFADLALELEQLLVLLDAHAERGAVTAELDRWLVGDTDTIACGLFGPCLGPSTQQVDVCVIADPSGARRRVPTRALALQKLSAPAAQIERSRRREGREDVALAALALAGPQGADVAVLFRNIYQFAYAPELHEGVLRVLLHRVGARLGDVASVAWREGRITLQHGQPLLLGDPRCGGALDDRVLLSIARDGRTTARSAASSLRMPLRTVQATLRQLANEGVCRVERSGRNVEYVVEDTTFREPTAW
ncbi:MAG: hypothetical protein KC503_39820 [Myxococcales bacterium]|nr:hypothetical protein [Myxococcales bacterium]